MKLYAITDRRRLSPATQPDAGPSEAALRQRLFALVEGWTTGGVDFIQLREKDLDPPQLQSLARKTMEKIDRSRSRLLLNISGAESAAVALAAGADGVHLSGRPAPGAARSVRQAFRAGGREAIISVPCHGLEDIYMAVEEQVDLLLFSPVFEKLSGVSPPQGLEALRRACAAAQGIPVFALGGVTRANTSDCLAAGAAGVAGIRLFAGEEWRRLKASQHQREETSRGFL
jgi:thiamine-phosphate pyrophosphorylase